MSGHFCEHCICSSHAGGWICPENAGDLIVKEGKSQIAVKAEDSGHFCEQCICSSHAGGWICPENAGDLMVKEGKSQIAVKAEDSAMSGHFCEQCICSSHAGGWICPENAGDLMTFSSSLTETKEMNGDVGRKRDETLQEGGAEDFSQTCKDAADALDKAVGTLEGRRGWCQVLENLKKNVVSVAFIGRPKSGKSTLINAFLGRKYLPMHRNTTTAVTTYVQCTPDPGNNAKLRNESGKMLGEGVQQIYKCLEVLNQEGNQQSGPLHVRSDLCDTHRLTTELIDIPGVYDSSRQSSAIALAVLEKSAAYVWVLPYDHLGDSDGITILKEICRSDEGAIRDRRLLIAVSKYDMYHSDMETEVELGEADLTKYIQDWLHEIKGIQKALVIPLSGKWAMLSEDLRNSPDSTLQRKAEKACEMFRGTSEPGSAQICDQLEAQSNISLLRTSVKWISDNGEEMLKKGTRDKFLHYLDQAFHTLKQQSENAEKRQEESEAAMRELTECQTSLQHKIDKLQGDDMEVQLRASLQKSFLVETKHPQSEMIKRTGNILKQYCSWLKYSEEGTDRPRDAKTTVVYYLKKVKGKVMDGTPDPIPMDMSKGPSALTIMTNEELIPTVKEVAGNLTLPGTAQVTSLLRMALKGKIELMVAEVNKYCNENDACLGWKTELENSCIPALESPAMKVFTPEIWSEEWVSLESDLQLLEAKCNSFFDAIKEETLRHYCDEFKKEKQKLLAGFKNSYGTRLEEEMEKCETETRNIREERVEIVGNMTKLAAHVRVLKNFKF